VKFAAVSLAFFSMSTAAAQQFSGTTTPHRPVTSSTPFTAPNGATSSASDSLRFGHTVNVVDDFGAVCNGSHKRQLQNYLRSLIN
jgi:hypothetical protein